MTDREDEATSFAVERPRDGTVLEVDRSVVLSRGDARELVGWVKAGVKGGRVLRRRRAVEGLYRIVPDEKQAKGLASGDLWFANPSSGDASVQLRNRAGFAGSADLKSVAPASAMKLIGPAAWQAMAMATQQHYLVEISGKLSAIDGKLDEVIARDEDLKVSSSFKARAMAAAVRTTLSDGGLVTPERREELGVLLRRIDDDWRELWVRTNRLLKAYQAEGSDPEDATRVNVAWSQLLRATQALAETSTAFAALPHDRPDTAAALRREESDRIAGCLEDLHELAERLHTAHARRQATRTLHDVNHPNNPLERVRRKVLRTQLPPGPGPLDARLAAIAGELAEPLTPPRAMLVDVREDGTALVAAE
jgi:hypothetical protein